MDNNSLDISKLKKAEVVDMENNPLDIDTLINFAENYRDKHKYEEAKTYYKQAFEINPKLIINYFESIPLSYLGFGPEEYELFKIALELDPENQTFNYWVFAGGYATTFSEDINFFIKIANKLLTKNYLLDSFMILELIEILIEKEMIQEAINLLNNFILEKYYLSKPHVNLFNYISQTSKGGFEDWRNEFFNKCILTIDVAIPILIEKNDLSSLKIALTDKIEILSYLEKYDDALTVLKNNKYLSDDADFIHYYEDIYYKKEDYVKLAYYSDQSLDINPDNNYSKLLKIISLSNLGKKEDASDLIKDILNNPKLPDSYYRYILSIAYQLEAYKLCENIFWIGFDFLNHDELKIFTSDYINILTILHEKDEKENEKLKKELEEEKTKVKKEIDLNRLEERMEKQHKEAMEAHGSTHKKLDTLSSLMSSYGSTLTEIKQSTDSIDDKVEKIQEQSLQVKEVLKKKYPKEFEDIKKELRRKLEI